LREAHFDIIWFGVVMTIVMEMGQSTRRSDSASSSSNIAARHPRRRSKARCSSLTVIAVALCWRSLDLAAQS
jgi:hypothetical protein